ncbi:U3 snoRNP protein, partial [Linnemannia zychae]
SPATFGVVQLYNSSTGELERTTNCRHGYSLEVGVLPDGLLVATVECETVYVFSTKSGVLKHTLSDHTNQVNDVTFSPCGHMIATGSDDMTICLWNADTGVLVRKFIRHESRVTCLRFSSDSQQIVSVDIGGNILVWEVGSGESKMLNEGNEHTVASGTGVGFSPINSLITAVCLTNTTIRIWNQLGNELLHSLEHKSPIVNFAWSYCEQWIATNGNNSIHLWNRSSDGSREWTCTLVIHDFQTVVRSIDWKSDILEFVTSCKDGSIRVWKLNETMDGWSAQLVWSVGGHVLVATDAIYSTAKDLNTTSQRLAEC